MVNRYTGYQRGTRLPFKTVGHRQLPYYVRQASRLTRAQYYLNMRPYSSRFKTYARKGIRATRQLYSDYRTIAGAAGAVYAGTRYVWNSLAGQSSPKKKPKRGGFGYVTIVTRSGHEKVVLGSKKSSAAARRTENNRKFGKGRWRYA